MTNFDFLKTEPKFASFADVAISAEKVYSIDYATSVLNCRRAMEFAVKWLYSVDSSLEMPYQDKLATLMSTDSFKDIVRPDIYKRMDYIRIIGNNVNHNPKNITKDQAKLAIQNLFVFMDFVAYCYAKDYTEHTYNEKLLEQVEVEQIKVIPEVDVEKLIKENANLKEQLTARREDRENTYVQKPLELTEFATRKAYIDIMLTDAGWERGKNWIDEYSIEEMPNRSNIGKADYVLFGDDGRPLAVIEAKKTCVDVSKGRQQAVLYANYLEKKFKRRPVIFLSNGFETRIWIDGKKGYPERLVSGIYSKRDLEKLFNIMSMRTPLDNIKIQDVITDRYYQKAAIKAVCETFDDQNRRKALLVMATGSGKTRVAISIVDVLIRHGWVKNVLFLSDRTSLVTQAKRSFHNLLPDLSLTNLCEEKDNVNARAVFSTYQTMINCIDDTKDEDGSKLFTRGHFDLIIVDEAHRSIYNKYKDIFTYFDALLIGLTATPKDEIEKSTYRIFELEGGVPTHGYELEQAVEDNYLVNFCVADTELKFMQSGISYNELSEEEKEEYEETFTTEDGSLPEKIESSALNEWLFNKDTMRKALYTLMTYGLKVDYGNKIGKTIIFAKNHNHAEEILKVWNEEYPNYPQHYARVIDNYTNYAQSLIDDFSSPEKMPQIAISVDMLDTGIDVPEILNLVFFKPVMSKSKFWQMIGRGTRLCQGLIDGKDKECFYIFDFCGVFDFFDVNKNGKETGLVGSLQERLFNLQVELAYKLQDLEYQTEDLISFRKELVQNLVVKVNELNRKNFAVKQHLRYVDGYSKIDDYNTLTYETTLHLAEHIAPLVLPDKDDISALRFDSLMYGLELAYLLGKKYKKARTDLNKKISALAGFATIPEISAQKEFIEKLLHTDYIDNAGINEFETIRTKLRDLMKYIKYDKRVNYITDFEDDIISINWREYNLSNDDLANYKAKVEYYLKKHEDILAIAKLKTNKPLTQSDVTELERILWNEVGTKQDYEKEYGDTPLGELVRSVVGLSIEAANEAFSKYLNDVNLNSMQINFVKRIVAYVVKNGMMKDLSVLGEPPFNEMGSVAEIFDDMSVWIGIRKVIDDINKNADVA
ncbi:MAG: DEAD/DEAH box helicase family protein [Clostridiaceae bacterium]|jgi:type I restriction enzyme R subunit|nr:DEAD/DEAH box helicase family protein [Clostridiaceae bacterium]